MGKKGAAGARVVEADVVKGTARGGWVKPVALVVIVMVVLASIAAVVLMGSTEEPNKKPVALINSPEDGDVFPTGGPVALDGSMSYDKDGKRLTCEWSSSIDGSLGQGCALNATLSKGDHDIVLLVRDGDGARDDASVAIRVLDPPVPSITSPSDGGIFYLDDSIAFDGTNSSSPNSATLDFDWASDLDGTLGDTATLATRLSLGTHVVTLTVHDGFFKRSTNVSIEVRKNNDPTAVISSPVSGLTYLNIDEVLFDAGNSTDPDGHALAYNWSSDLEGALGTAASFRKVLTTVGAHTITLVVEDGHGGKGTDQLTIKVELPNDPPIADAGDDVSARVADLLTFNGSASSDPEGGALAYSWDMGDGTVLTGMVVDHIFTEDGVHTVTLTVEDPLGASDTDSLTATIDGAMPEGAVLYGFILDNKTGDPISNASVSFDAYMSDRDEWFWDFTFTGETGFYRFDVPEADECTLSASHEEYIFYYTEELFVTVAGVVKRMDIRLDPLPAFNTRVYGVVYDQETSEPIPAAGVSFNSYEYGAFRSVETGDDGTYEVYLFPDEWEYSAFAMDYYFTWDMVLVGTSDLNLDIPLVHVMPENSRIYGWVNDSATGEFLAEADVEVYDDDYQYFNWTYTDQDGYYEMDVPAGTFTLECYFWGGEYDKVYSTFMTEVTLGEYEELLLNISLSEYRREDQNVTFTFDNWNLLDYRNEIVTYEDTPSLRESLDLDYDGTVTALEVTTFENLMEQFMEVDDTQDFLYVDDIYYDVVPGSVDIEIIGAEGPVNSTDPVTMVMTAQFTSHVAIPIALTHDIMLNISYDDPYSNITFWIVLPTGFSYASSSHSSAVEVSGTTTVMIDPGDDPDFEDEEYGEWVTITVG